MLSKAHTVLDFIGPILAIEFGIEAVQGDQLVVVTRFGDNAILKNEDEVSIPDRRQTMSDDDTCSTLLSSVQSFLNNLLGLGVQGRRDFILQKRNARGICKKTKSFSRAFFSPATIFLDYGPRLELDDQT